MSWISRHRTPAAAIAAVCVGGLSLAACGQAAPDQRADVLVGTRPSEDGAGATIARASASTGAVESGRIRMSYTMSGSGDGQMFDLTMAGEGAFSDFGARSELTIETSGGPGDGVGGMPLSMVVHEIVDGTTTYMRVESAVSIPGLTDSWTKLDMSEMPGGAGADAGGIGGIAGWSGFLDSLKGAGSSVVESGTDTIDGVPVTVYTGAIDPESAISQASPEDAADVQAALDQMGGSFDMPFTAWVDAGGLIRKLEMRVSSDMAGTTMDMTMTLELYDFGAPVSIEVPSPDEITDLGGLGGLGELLGPEVGTA